MYNVNSDLYHTLDFPHNILQLELEQSLQVLEVLEDCTRVDCMVDMDRMHEAMVLDMHLVPMDMG